MQLGRSGAKFSWLSGAAFLLSVKAISLLKLLQKLSAFTARNINHIAVLKL